MKKNYSTPEFMLVSLDSNDIVCTSPEKASYGGKWDPNQGTPTAGANRRNDIWDE